MKKLKIVLFVAGALVLAVLCAGLPKLTAMLMDKQVEKAPDYNSIRPVELELQEGAGDMSMLAKLSLYCNGQSVGIKAEKAIKTPDEIRACVVQFLDRCQTDAIFQDVELPGMTVSPYMVYRANDPTEFIIVWRCYATKTGPEKNASGQSELRTLDVVVDDETGKILSVSFDHYYVSYSQDGIWQRNKERLESLTDLYFAQLGLTEIAEAAEAEPDKYCDYQNLDTGVTQVYYTIIDPECGAIKILFATGGADTFGVVMKG